MRLKKLSVIALSLAVIASTGLSTVNVSAATCNNSYTQSRIYSSASQNCNKTAGQVQGAYDYNSIKDFLSKNNIDSSNLKPGSSNCPFTLQGIPKVGNNSNTAPAVTSIPKNCPKRNSNTQIPQKNTTTPAPTNASSAPAATTPATTAPQSTQAPAPTTDVTESSPANQVITLVNQERAKAGLAPLKVDQNLVNAAIERAKETEVSFSHTRPNGTKFSTVLAENGISYRGAGENIAYGQPSAERVMQDWMNSQGHRANILNPNFTTIGVGYYQGANGVNYWTQEFVY